MLAAHRRKEIFTILMLEKQVLYSDLAKQFRVSAMTVRRDVEQLEIEGKAIRVHGGAILSDQKWDAEPIQDKVTVNVELKLSIADTILSLIKPGSSLFLDTGSTMYSLAQALKRHFNGSLKICTPDIEVIRTLAGDDRFTLFAIGGLVDGSTFSVIGEHAIDMINNFRADRAIIGCDGLTIRHGAMAAQVTHVGIKRAMMDNSVQSILAVDSSKIGRMSFAAIAPLDHFDLIVTDFNIQSDTLSSLEKSGIKVNVAKDLGNVN
ncbi:DeoR/GlpR family DNA-binding transcription regulator [Alicyclobacillus tolerans]|uniref:DeoR/GlpR family DNA-binding transcription regulator n=1 Tax=Alicyclobacillus tolerans TaxID=90970 RepID=UPI001F22BFC5|nr:DeoR/GlpR family DNA-binding transcription regulator [Alicyclobacillus tolerans]MCF8567360.1 DeoR/GlpR family DNA-binding transcription regulator [Alicyclobacillus tolerans]